jgi:hypothetical protein
MRTIGEALMDEVMYPLPAGFVANKLLARGLDADEEVTQDILLGTPFMGAVADSLYALIEAPNFSEADKSVSLSDKSLILKKANLLYAKIGEAEKQIDQPKVTFL